MQYKLILLSTIFLGVALINANAEILCPRQLTFEEYTALNEGEKVTFTVHKNDRTYKKNEYWTSPNFTMSPAGKINLDEPFYNGDLCVYDHFKGQNYFGISRVRN